MDISTSLAVRNYEQAKTAVAAQPSQNAGPDWGALAENFTDTLLQHESAARNAMAGQGSPHALVQALSSSQLAVETVTTIRDRVVEAYQEILRMQV